MKDSNDHSSNSGHMPELFDRLMGNLEGLPDVVATKPSVFQVTPPLGVGGTQLYVVQTFRQREEGDTIFLQHSSAELGMVRIVLPKIVCDAITRQRDSLTTKVRRKISKASAQDRKQRGIPPAFLKGKVAKKS